MCLFVDGGKASRTWNFQIFLQISSFPGVQFVKYMEIQKKNTLLTGVLAISHGFNWIISLTKKRLQSEVILDFFSCFLYETTANFSSANILKPGCLELHMKVQSPVCLCYCGASAAVCSCVWNTNC